MTAAKPELDNGRQVTTGDWSVSSILSHEVLELFVDPNCNLWANDGKGTAFSFEACDPVEAPSYTVSGVSVSNFVTPSWFDPRAAASAQFDKLGLLHAPFSVLKGGYVSMNRPARRSRASARSSPAGASRCWPARDRARPAGWDRPPHYGG